MVSSWTISDRNDLIRLCMTLMHDSKCSKAPAFFGRYLQPLIIDSTLHEDQVTSWQNFPNSSLTLWLDKI